MDNQNTLIVNDLSQQTSDSSYSFDQIPSQTNQTSPQVSTNQMKEILISGGAGAISFQAGYMHGIQEIIPLETLKEYRVGGVSAGSCIAGYFVLSLYSKHDMKYWYEKYIRRVLNQINQTTFGFWQTTNMLDEVARQSFREAKALNIPFDDTFHLYVSVRSGLIGYRKQLVDKFTDEKQFGEAIACSCTIPFVTSFSFSNTYQGKKAIDGGATMAIPFRNKDSDCIFLNVLPKFCRQYPMVRERPNNIFTIDIAEEYNLVFPTDYWLWDEQNADKQFLQGYLAAKNHKDKLLKAFKLDKLDEQVISN